MAAKRRILLIAPPVGRGDPGLGAGLDAQALEVVRSDAAGALDTLDREPSDVVIVESGPKLETSLGLLRSVEERWPGLPVLVVLDAAGDAEFTRLFELGAHDLLLRPLAPEQLAFAVSKALAVVRRAAAAPPPPRVASGIVFGSSPAMRTLKQLLEQVAPSPSTVLVRGESGTGKELVARAVHRLSPRAERPFVKIDCASLPETLIESELFGYEKGAFTGASAQKLGRVQLADTGTLFLDEIGELPPAVQAKLLRLLQDRELERLGGKQTLRVDVRVVAATHRDLEGMVERGEFRQDLFYRLNVVPLWIAPLRARRVDVPELAKHFCDEVVKASSSGPVELEESALKLLAAQRWPGNARQLQNFVERLVVLCRGRTITEADVSGELARPVRFATETGTAGADAGEAIPNGDPVSLAEAVCAAERDALTRALERAKNNRSAAARLLGVSRTTLYAKLEEHGLL